MSEIKPTQLTRYHINNTELPEPFGEFFWVDSYDGTNPIYYGYEERTPVDGSTSHFKTRWVSIAEAEPAGELKLGPCACGTLDCSECNYEPALDRSQPRAQTSDELEDHKRAIKPLTEIIECLQVEIAELKERMRLIAGDLNEICDGAEETDIKNEVYHPASYYAGMERGVLAVLARITGSRGNG